jgi:AcrR family transcriptional regulator
MAQRSAAAKSTDRFERKREAILDAATRISEPQGDQGLTLGDTAAAVELSTTSVTYYFKRKDDLAAACITRGDRDAARHRRRGDARRRPPSGCTAS